MSSQRPDVSDLGPQEEALKEAGLTPLSHEKEEFVILENVVEISFKASVPVKFTSCLTQERTKTELNDYVFAQTDEGKVGFVLHLPESGWYTFQIYALPKSNESKSLKNVYNYLIHCKQALKSVYPCPKQFAIWKEGCRLYEPMMLNSHVRLRNVNFKAKVPKARAVAVVVDGEWTALEKKDNDIWEGKMNLDQYKDKGVKLTLNGNFEEDETKYATLLEYKI